MTIGMSVPEMLARAKQKQGQRGREDSGAYGHCGGTGSNKKRDKIVAKHFRSCMSAGEALDHK